MGGKLEDDRVAVQAGRVIGEGAGVSKKGSNTEAPARNGANVGDEAGLCEWPTRYALESTSNQKIRGQRGL